jgi:hypothetical protein
MENDAMVRLMIDSSFHLLTLSWSDYLDSDTEDREPLFFHGYHWYHLISSVLVHSGDLSAGRAFIRPSPDGNGLNMTMTSYLFTQKEALDDNFSDVIQD